MRAAFAVSLVSLAAWPARASLWEDATAQTIGTTAGWSNKVELADIDGDGDVDILFANGGNYSAAGTPEQNEAFLNAGPGNPFTNASDAVFGTTGDLARVVKARDVDGDGDLDIAVGTTYQTQSRLYRNDGGGAFTEVTATALPQQVGSVGDLEFGDVDGDGDLDMVLADWGPGNPLTSNGGRTRLWLNDGDGAFTDATAQRMPDVLVRWSWELELLDVDGDYDLDVVVSCKSCAGSYLFRNDGAGAFAHDAAALPQFANNYEFEAMDLDGDGWLDLVTINDGPSLREHVFAGDGSGFVDMTSAWWPAAANLGDDDNMVAFADVDSDGDSDFVIGSLSGSDRLLVNDGSGGLTVDEAVFSGTTTPGTLGIAVADLDGDDKLDVVQSQGETASADKVFFGVDIAADTAAPAVERVETVTSAGIGATVTVRARIHDRKTPVAGHDFAEVAIAWSENDGVERRDPMTWYGGLLWRADIGPLPAGTAEYRVCATDAAGSETCSATTTIAVADPPDAGPLSHDAGSSNDAGPGADTDGGGCGCRSSAGGGGWIVAALAALVFRRRQ